MKFLLRPLRLLVPFLTTFSGVMNPSVAYAEPESRAAELADAIAGAKTSVDVMSRSLHQAAVHDALAAASQRGVQVRILLEGKQFEGEPAPGTCQELTDGASQLDECLAQGGQVDLRYLYSPFVDGRELRIPQSYLVIDGRTVLVSKAAGLAALKSKKLVKTYVSRFDRAFAAGREPFRRLAAGGTLCGRLRPVSADFRGMRSLKRFVAACE